MAYKLMLSLCWIHRVFRLKRNCNFNYPYNTENQIFFRPTIIRTSNKIEKFVHIKLTINIRINELNRIIEKWKRKNKINSQPPLATELNSIHNATKLQQKNTSTGVIHWIKKKMECIHAYSSFPYTVNNFSTCYVWSVKNIFTRI